jgi:hypothetical protein
MRQIQGIFTLVTRSEDDGEKLSIIHEVWPTQKKFFSWLRLFWPIFN